MITNYHKFARYLLFTSGEGPESIDRASFVVANQPGGSRKNESNSDETVRDYDSNAPGNSRAGNNTSGPIVSGDSQSSSANSVEA